MTTAAKVRLGLFVTCLAALGWGFRQLLFEHAPAVFSNPQEDMSFAWFVPLFSLCLLWRDRRELVRSAGSPDWRGALLALPFLACGFLGVRGVQVRLEMVGLIGLLVALPFAFFGAGTARRVLFPAAFLLFCIPLATYLDVVTVHLRLMASSVAYGVLQLFGSDVVRRGTMLVSDQSRFAIDVADPCSGLRSLFAMMALTAGYAYLFLPTWTRRAALFALSVPIAIFANVVRIVTIAVIAATCSVDFATGFYHDWSGYVVFATAIALMLGAADLVARGAKKGTEGVRQETGDLSGRQETKDEKIHCPPTFSTCFLLLPLSILFSLFMLFQARIPAAEYPPDPPAALGEVAGCESTAQEVTRAELSGLPADTRIEKRLYRDADCVSHLVTAVTGGRSKSSIHRPELCLPAQGFAMSEPRDLVAGGVDWRVLTLRRRDAPPVRFAYTFRNQAGYRTSSHLARIFRDVWDRSVHGRIDRWTMFEVYSGAVSDERFAAFLEKLTP